jgi:hypothetical protein
MTKKRSYRSRPQDCHVSLRSGTLLPERQPPKENDKDKSKEKGKTSVSTENEVGPSSKTKATTGDYNVIAHQRRIPALLSVFDALMM